jgi:hypothetical protein
MVFDEILSTTHRARITCGLLEIDPNYCKISRGFQYGSVGPVNLERPLVALEDFAGVDLQLFNPSVRSQQFHITPRWRRE